MGNLNRFDEPMDDEMNKPAACAVCEAMLPDAVDGSLSEAEQRLFDKHVAGCVACAEELAEAQRGAAWLQMLKGHTPEPSANLLSKILAQTTGAETAAPATHAVHVPATPNVVMMPAMLPQETDFARPAIAAQTVAKTGKLIEFRRKITQIFTIENATLSFQPRLAMTAAMAFFSVALTLNMTGVRLGNLKMADLKPSTLRRTVIDTTASAARSFHSMRVVYQVESKLEDLRDDSRSDELLHSASPYATPSSRSEEPKQQQDNTDQKNEQAKPQGHSELKFLTISAEQPSEKGA